MDLIIQEGAKRGYLTEGDMYSNGNQIRLITSIGLQITYKNVVDGIISEIEKRCKVETFEAWAKWNVIKKTW